MKDERTLYKEIINEKNLDENIQVFFNKCASTNYVYAGMDLTIHYFNLYEALNDSNIKPTDEFIHLLMELNKYINEYLLTNTSQNDMKEAVQKLDHLRNRLIDKMQMLTIYSDKFLLYEYILNKMSLSFNDNIQDIELDKAHNDIMNYIFSEKDKVAVNEKIRNVLYYLPVRLTKNKFFDLVKNAVYLYIGHESSLLDDFIYKIKSSAGIQEQILINEVYEEKLTFLNGIDYNSIQKEEYEGLLSTMADITKLLYDETDSYYSLQEIVNSLYAVILNMDFAGEKEKRYIMKLMQEINRLNNGFNQMFKETGHMNLDNEDVIDISDVFEAMEGKLEEYSEKLQNSQMVMSKIMEESNKAYDALRSLDIYKALEISIKLLGGSLFIDFRNVQKNEIVDRKYAEEAALQINDEFFKYLSKQDRSLNRAMMASVLKELPLFFTDSKSVSDYIKTSFNSCHDAAERIKSYNLIMEDLDN